MISDIGIRVSQAMDALFQRKYYVQYDRSAPNGFYAGGQLGKNRWSDAIGEAEQMQKKGYSVKIIEVRPNGMQIDRTPSKWK